MKLSLTIEFGRAETPKGIETLFLWVLFIAPVMFGRAETPKGIEPPRVCSCFATLVSLEEQKPQRGLKLFNFITKPVNYKVWKCRNPKGD